MRFSPSTRVLPPASSPRHFPFLIPTTFPVIPTTFRPHPHNLSRHPRNLSRHPRNLSRHPRNLSPVIPATFPPSSPQPFPRHPRAGGDPETLEQGPDQHRAHISRFPPARERRLLLMRH
ncbi:MAG TPA: hypothetical protein ENJ05_05680 [Thiotrichales bacterium]|nr:hypothetical protein [Thiotrichales bacterium]